MKKALFFDGNSIMNRAFYGIKPLKTKDGLFTNAVYGYVSRVSWGSEMFWNVIVMMNVNLL